MESLKAIPIVRRLGAMRARYLAGAAAVLVALIGMASFVPNPEAAPATAQAAESGANDVVRADAGARTPSSAALEASLALPMRPPVEAAEHVTRVPKPEHVRGLYVNAWAAGSSRKLAKLIDIANRTEINAFVIDVKEGGLVSYRSSVPLVREIDADRAYVRDIRDVLAQLRANGIYPVARIVCFKDPTLARARPEWAVRKADDSPWLDNHGDAWVDSFNRHVWDYNIAIAREAIELGFSEIQWDYVRFPDVPRSYMRTAVWPARNGRTKEDAIREFLVYSHERLADLHVPITADVFGLTVSARDDMGIGQYWEKMADVADVLLPMIYPSHFARGSYGIPYPNAEPYTIIRTALAHALQRNEPIAQAAAIRPWLQDFTLGRPDYGAAHVRAQIQAVYDAGLSEWVLWHPGSNYSVAALAPPNGIAPRFPLPDSFPGGEVAVGGGR